MMHMTLYLAVLRVSGAAFNPGFLPGSYEALLYLCLPMVLMETAFLGTLGTTPGKAMLGVSVRDYRGRRLSFPMAFRRSLFVMVLGLGCFAPSLMLLALFFLVVGAPFRFYSLGQEAGDYGCAERLPHAP